MGIKGALFWINLFLYTFKDGYMSQLIWNDKVKARIFHATKRFIDDRGILNDRGKFNGLYKDIYPSEFITTESLTLWYTCHFIKIGHHGKK